MTRTVYYTTIKDVKTALEVLSQAPLENNHAFDSVVCSYPKKRSDIIMIHSFVYRPEAWPAKEFFKAFKDDILVELPNGKEYVGSI